MKVGHLYIPTNFTIMYIKEYSQVRIIIGRPFLRTSGVIIDVKKEKLAFEVGNERIEFIKTSILKDPYTKVSCYLVNEVENYDETKTKKPTIEVEKKTTAPIKKNEPSYRKKKTYDETNPLEEQKTSPTGYKV